jgi:hypothetical protein
MLVDEKPECCADCIMCHEAFLAGEHGNTFELIFECFLIRQGIEGDTRLADCPLIEFNKQLMIMED